mmetsp:Transcript_28007/g.32645  ORF Transcript_28007/g.32645 Transcript_28007/m.32645 type:complete len:526 (+) Transcript_28007:1805-3382(+)
MKTNQLEMSLKHFERALSKFNYSTIDDSVLKASQLEYAQTLFRVGTGYHKLYASIDLDRKKKLSNSERLNWINKKRNYLDSAKMYYGKVEKLQDLNPKIQSLKGTAFTNISTIYEEDSSFVQALFYIDKAIAIHKKNKHNIKTASALNNKGNIFLSQKEYQKSKEIYLEGIALVKNNNNPSADRPKANLYYNLGWAMRNLNDYKAYDFQEKSFEIEDDIRDKEVMGLAKQISAEYDVNVAKRNVRKEEEIKRLKAQRGFWIAGIFCLIIIISLGYWLKLNKLKQKNLALKFEQTELIQNKNLEKLKSDSQVRILNATIDGKESERKQIAETLHDSVSALLSSANLHLQATRKQFNGSTPIEIDKTQKIIIEASHKIRDLSHTLVSSVLLKFGLDFAIKDIAEKYSNSAINIDTEINDIVRYHQDFEIKVYNIIHEFVNNILKHSKANNALIELKEVDKKLFLTISDDGVGFDKTKINMKDGLGINQIDARIQIMKGEFFIESSFNNGTIIFIELPVLEKEELNHV